VLACEKQKITMWDAKNPFKILHHRVDDDEKGEKHVACD